MTSIKRPGGPSTVDPSVGQEPTARTNEGSGARFDAILSRTDEPSSVESARANLVAGFRPGEVTREAAIQALIAEQLSSPMAQGLTAEGRRALEEHLRFAMENDPNLAYLLDRLTD